MDTTVYWNFIDESPNFQNDIDIIKIIFHVPEENHQMILCFKVEMSTI